MAERDLDVTPSLRIPASELRETASRASGPGGQHVNKASTRVTLRWNAAESTSPSDAQRARILARLGPRLTRRGELVVHAQRFRSRARNRALARERMAELLRAALARRRRRIATQPGRGVREQRLAEKRRRGSLKRERGRPPRED